jgi:thiol-disulfide isomerase/thioredoxin
LNNDNNFGNIKYKNGCNTNKFRRNEISRHRVCAYYAYSAYVKRNGSHNPNNEHMPVVKQGQQGDTATIMLFYADWCPHCKSAKPFWNEVRQEYEGSTVNGYNIVFTEVDCTNDQNEDALRMMQKYKVENFPTVKMIKGNEVIEYDANINVSNLSEFIKSN